MVVAASLRVEQGTAGVSNTALPVRAPECTSLALTAAAVHRDAWEAADSGGHELAVMFNVGKVSISKKPCQPGPQTHSIPY